MFLRGKSILFSQNLTKQGRFRIMPVFFSVEERDKKGKKMDEDGDADNGSPKNHIVRRYSV